MLPVMTIPMECGGDTGGASRVLHICWLAPESVLLMLAVAVASTAGGGVMRCVGERPSGRPDRIQARQVSWVVGHRRLRWTRCARGA
jgi:hypothetical protein